MSETQGQDEGDPTQPTFCNYYGNGSKFNSQPCVPLRPIVSSAEWEADEYSMAYGKFGKVVIINNKRFDETKYPGKHIRDRVNTDVDARNIIPRLIQLGFADRDIDIHNNATKDKVSTILQKVANDNEYNEHACCFVCVVLSYGEEGVIYCYDGPLEIKELLKPFKGDKCVKLATKPKIFIIQADDLTLLPTDQRDAQPDSAEPKGPADDTRIELKKIPVEANFLTVFNSIPAIYEWMDEGKVAWFVKALCDVLEKEALAMIKQPGGVSMDLLKMFTRVNGKIRDKIKRSKISNEKLMGMKIPLVTSMLTKRIVFKHRPQSIQASD